MALKITPPRKLVVPSKPAIIKPKPIGLAPRTQPARQLQVPATAKGAPSTLGGGFATAHALNEEREARANRAFEFSMKVGEGGMQGVTIILTDHVRLPQMPYFCYMHRWGFDSNPPAPKTEVCITDGPEGCPLCRSLGKKGSYEMMLSCIDPRKYIPEKGPKKGIEQPRQRRPYPVKMSMIPAFERLYQSHKTYRGMVLRLFRDKKLSPATGSQVEFVKMLDEATLKKYGDLAKPFDYTVQYPRLSAEKMALQYNIDHASAGAVGAEDAPGGSVGSDDDLPF